MQCDRWKKMIIDRLADELDEEDSISLEQHLANCEICRQEDVEMRHALAAVSSPDEWRPATGSGAAIQGHLLREMRRIHAGDASDRSHSPALQQARIGWLGSLLGPLTALIRHPLPSYAALSLVLISVIAGFWLGKAGGAHTQIPGSSISPPGAGITPATYTPDDEMQGRPGQEIDSFATATLCADTSSWSSGSVAAHSDAIRLPLAVPVDSL